MSILVTGGSSGIGRAVAVAFGTPGTDVFINYHHHDAAAQETAEQVRAGGGTPHLVKVDVGSPVGAAEIAERIGAVTDRLDHYVHCACPAVTGGGLDVDVDRYTEAIHVNATSVLYLAQALLPLMGAGSSIVYVSSRGSRVVVPNYIALGTSKALGESIIRYLAVELARSGIRANTVAAGALDTPTFRAMFPDDWQRRLEGAAKANPSGRGVGFDDVVATVRFLVSPEAAMVQGQTVMVDGGISL